MMHGKPQSNNLERMFQQSPLLINTHHTPDSNVRSLQKDHSQQVLKENQQAQHLDSRAVDSALHFLKASGLTR